MAITIDIEYNGRKYKLGFNRKTIKEMERDGFSFSEAEGNEVGRLLALYRGAFKQYQPKMTDEEIDEVFGALVKEQDEESIYAVLMEMVQEPLSVLSSPEGEESKKATWVVNR